MNLRKRQAQYFESEFEGRAAKTLENHRFYLEEFIIFIGNRKLDPYTYQDWVKYSFQRWSPQTARMLALAASNRFLIWLERTGHILQNPHRVTRAPIVKQSDPRSPVTQDEFNALMNAASNDHELRWAILCGWETGMAIGDVSLLQWSSITLEQSTIIIRRKKTQERCVIPLRPNGMCIEALELKLMQKRDHWPNKPKEGVFYVDTDLALLYLRGSGAIQTRFAVIRKKAGISPEKSFHNLRAAYCSRIANTGMNLALCCKMTGHKNPSIFEHYVSPELEKLKDVVNQAWG